MTIKKAMNKCSHYKSNESPQNAHIKMIFMSLQPDEGQE